MSQWAGELYSAPLFFSLALSSSVCCNPPFPMTAINFPLFFIQPFNRHLRPLIGLDLSFAHPPPPYIKTFSFLSFSFHILFPFSEAPPPPPPSFISFSGSSMVKTHGGSAFRPRECRSSPSPADGYSPAAPAAAAAAPPAAPPTAPVAAPATA